MFLTETAEFADVVLPAAGWGEKLGTFTNADRTVHLSEPAVAPPGQARSDLDIFLDYARRMDFRDRDGEPLIRWTDAESAFAAWQACSRGRPCDYSGLSYAQLRLGSGIPWPCTDAAPAGTERLYTKGVFNTDPEYCETYGQDLTTGAQHTAEQYRAKQPNGRAFLHAAPYQPSPEVPTEEYPLLLTTGRTVYQFHTRTKTGRTPQLQAAAPETWVELNPDDAATANLEEGDLIAIESPRGRIQARARICGIRPGVVFVPFHYGYWDRDPSRSESTRDTDRAANELTITGWDPVSKQPLFKVAAVRISLVERAHGTPSPAPAIGAARPVARDHAN
jgi:anaerobic selenocysteine-containing dehydrogenase